MTRLEELHKAYEEKDAKEYDWVFTCQRPPPPRKVVVWIKADGVDIFGQVLDFRYAEEHYGRDVVAWKDL